MFNKRDFFNSSHKIEKDGNLPYRGKRSIIQHYFMVILYNKIMQNYHLNCPPKEVRVVYPQNMVT